MACSRSIFVSCGHLLFVQTLIACCTTFIVIHILSLRGLVASVVSVQKGNSSSPPVVPRGGVLVLESCSGETYCRATPPNSICSACILLRESQSPPPLLLYPVGSLIHMLPLSVLRPAIRHRDAEPGCDVGGCV